MTPAATDWVDHAQATLERGGYRTSAPRAAVVTALADLGCSVTVREISDRLEADGQDVGLASIYRALELLDRLGLVKRFEVGEGTARYEPAHPDGDHHHHIVCDSCGTVAPFEDQALEEVIHRLSNRVSFNVAEHDVTLHGECPACHASS